jgi:hypothetical protein
MESATAAKPIPDAAAAVVPWPAIHLQASAPLLRQVLRIHHLYCPLLLCCICTKLESGFVFTKGREHKLKTKPAMKCSHLSKTIQHYYME